MAGSDIFYWDSSVFISWLLPGPNNGRTKEEMEGIAQVVEEFDRGNCMLVTSVITKAELLPSRLGEGGTKKLNMFWKRKLFQPVEVTEAVIDMANFIRDHYAERSMSVPKTPDSIHMASAILNKVDIIHTFDGGGDKKGMLDLNGNVAGYNLTIRKPRISDQQNLFEAMGVPPPVSN